MSNKSNPPKTLAMRILDSQKVAYTVYTFPDSIHDAPGVADFVGASPEKVYKTLVLESPGERTRYFLVMVPASARLDLKQTASALGLKRMHMCSHKDAERLTGLKVGGISALALLNRRFTILISKQAEVLERVLISAGRRGINLELSVDDLVRVCDAGWIRCCI